MQLGNRIDEFSSGPFEDVPGSHQDGCTQARKNAYDLYELAFKSKLVVAFQLVKDAKVRHHTKNGPERKQASPHPLDF